MGKCLESLRHGIWGLSNASVEGQDPALSEQEIREYGIDWKAYRNPQVQHHYHVHNMTDVAWEGDFNPFVGPKGHCPERFLLVEVDDAQYPFTYEGLFHFVTALVNNIPENICTIPKEQKQYFILALDIAHSMSSV